MSLKKNQFARLKIEKQQKKNIEASWLHALTPLEDRLKKLLNEMPDSVKVDGLSLPVIQKMLKGRWRGNAHPGELGEALRKLGYIRRRKWIDSINGYKTLWLVRKDF